MSVDLEEFERWDPKTKAKVAAKLQARLEKPRKVWYCKKGRTCDGRPHDDIDYNHARSDQWPPPGVDWFTWLIMSGRGAGKTRTGSEFLRVMSKHHARIAAIGRRTFDIRATLVEGESGLIKTCENAGVEYLWEPSKREFTFTGNGSKVYFYSAEEPDSLRGPQNELAWLDEPAHMPLIEDVWSNLLLGLRLGPRPRILITSTPLPIPWLKTLIKRDDTHLVRVSTYANLDNLAESYRRTVIEQYEGTRLGRQELHGELIEDVEGALWSAEVLSLAQMLPEDVTAEPNPLDIEWERIVIGVDPAGTANPKSDETGIVVCALYKGLAYVLEDATDRYSPDGWAKKVVSLYRKWGADRVVAEKNYGGDMVAANLRNQDENLPITEVTSRRGKQLRAEPVVGRYEQGRVKHLPGLEKVETEMLEWVPGESPSPNRIDAVVHALTNLGGKGGPASIASARGKSLTNPASAYRRLPSGLHIPR